ncbi:MAG: exodeoxyribonuclease VII small subunit [Actinomycetes bacterium]
MAATDTPPDELGFTAAVAELDQIVADLESNQLDVDALTTKVARAAELVTWCRSRIDGTRLQVEQVLTTLGTSDD